MAQLLLVNPRPPRKSKKGARKMPAKRNAKGQFIKRGRRAAPAKKRRRTRRNPSVPRAKLRSAPRRASTPARRRRRPVAAKRRAVRRNPRRNAGLKLPTLNGVINDLVMPAAAGSVGAIANDAIYTYLPWPEKIRANMYARYALKMVSAVFLAVGTGALVDRKIGSQVGVGAMISLFTDGARALMLQMDVGAQAAVEGIGYYNPAMPAGIGMYNSEMGVYVPGAQQSPLPSLADPTELHGHSNSEFVEGGYSYS